MAIRRPRAILSPFPDGRCCNAGAATSIFFVATKVFLATNTHKIVCCDRYLSRQNICRDKHMFVATKLCLSRQRFLSQQEYFLLRQRRFVLTMTKMILMAAPANGSVLSQQTRKVCRDKNDTYGSSRQW